MALLTSLGEIMRPPADVIGVILAGGRSRRFGSDKAFARLGERSLIDHVRQRFAGQVGAVVISGDPADPRLAALALPVVPDRLTAVDGGSLGPLAGIHAALCWTAAQAPQAVWLAAVSVDTPLLPLDLIDRLREAAGHGAPLACAGAGGRVHPIPSLWSVRLVDELEQTLRRGERAVHAVAARLGAATADFPEAPPDAFANVNTPADLDRLARLLETGN